MVDVNKLQEKLDEKFTNPLGEISDSIFKQKEIYKKLADYVLDDITRTIGLEADILHEVGIVLYSISIKHIYLLYYT